MADLKATFKDSDTLEVSHDASDLCWTFRVVWDQSGRLHLEGPKGSKESMARGDLLQRACVFAQSEALHSGRVDY